MCHVELKNWRLVFLSLSPSYKKKKKEMKQEIMKVWENFPPSSTVGLWMKTFEPRLLHSQSHAMEELYGIAPLT